MRKGLFIGLAAVVVLAALFVSVRHYAQTHGGTANVSIPVGDGVKLSATITRPDGSGKHPLVVMPTAWGATQAEYSAVAKLFGSHGFVVVAYTQRGFNQSGGEADFAGPSSVADVSKVIDWAVSHDHADSSHVGMLGQSLGAGVSLLAAERDPRIKAVAALSTWTDWGGSLVQNGTLTSRTIRTVLLGGVIANRRLDSDMNTIVNEYLTDPAAAIALIEKLSKQRSPIDDVAALNKNHTAVMLANGLQDAIFDPQQLVALYQKLDGPKRLQLATGDHTQAEAKSFGAGTATGPLGDALNWLEQYVAGKNTGIDKQDPIEVQDSVTGVQRGLTAWPTASAADKVDLSLPTGSTNFNQTAGAWTAVMQGGRDTVAASAGEAFAIAQPYRFTTANLNLINHAYGLRWDSPAVSAATTLQGTPTLTASINATAATATIFAYLYDVNQSGVGRLISATPDTITNLAESTEKTISLNLRPIDWTIAAGHHVALVVDTADGRWTTQTTLGEGVGVSSLPTAPASITIPTS